MRSLPSISSIVYWQRFISDCRANSLTGTAKVVINKSMYVVRRAIRRFELFRLDAASDWLDFPFRLRGSIKWSPTLLAWYVLEDEGSLGAMAKSRVEPEEWMMNTLSSGMIVIDVGAHQGRYVIEFSRRVGETGLVIAIEPNGRNLEVLTENIKMNRICNVRAIRTACWSCRETLQFLRSTTLDLVRVAKSASEGGDLIGLPLDDLVASLILNRVDLVKIDVEGAELDVLEGSRNTLAQFRPHVFVECHGTLSDVLVWFQRQRYAVNRYQKDPHHGEGFAWVLAVPDHGSRQDLGL